MLSFLKNQGNRNLFQDGSLSRFRNYRNLQKITQIRQNHLNAKNFFPSVLATGNRVLELSTIDSCAVRKEDDTTIQLRRRILSSKMKGQTIGPKKNLNQKHRWGK